MECSKVFVASSISKEFQEDFWKKKFFALKDLSFEIEKGKITGFLGANGAGKTTFLKILLRFITPTSGEINFKGDQEFFKSVGYMPERPYYYEHLTGREYLRYCGKLQDLSDEKIEKSSLKWTKELKVDFALDRILKTYSKGMLQRIGFASALLHDPELIILDEPLSGLDPVGRKEFKDILVSINQKYNCTVFFSSHIVSDVEEVCHNVLVIEKGELIYNGEIQKLLTQSSEQNVIFELDRLPKNWEKEMESSRKGEHFFVTVDLEDKSKFTKTLLSEGVDILSMNHDTYTLEEVVYNLR